MTDTFAKYAMAAFLIGAAASPAAAALDARTTTPVGVWLYQNSRFAVEIEPCGDRLCGKISWLKAPRDAQGLPRVDSANTDPMLRTRPVLGLTILDGFRRAADGTWQDGEIYNPEDGTHYHASMSMNGDGSLRLRAYVVVPLFGKTLSLTRMS